MRDGNQSGGWFDGSLATPGHAFDRSAKPERSRKRRRFTGLSTSRYAHASAPRRPRVGPATAADKGGRARETAERVARASLRDHRLLCKYRWPLAKRRFSPIFRFPPRPDTTRSLFFSCQPYTCIVQPILHALASIVLPNKLRSL